MKSSLYPYICLFFVLFDTTPSFAQVKEPSDTFFLLKKKGLLKKLGQKIYRESHPEIPVKAVNPFLTFQGKTIRTISIAPTGFNKIVHDTLGVKKTFISNLADVFHRNTLPKVIRKNLFFKEGDKVLPMLLADNERFLRDQPFLRDALIVLQADTLAPGTVDIIIFTKDVFSLGGSVKVNNEKKAQVNLRDENFFGTGNEIGIYSLIDRDRIPAYAPGVSLSLRNIRHSFINIDAGFRSFNTAFNSGRPAENNYYLSLSKPLVNRYTRVTGGAAFSYSSTAHVYPRDSFYFSDFKYRLLSTDIWGGYNVGWKNKRSIFSEKRLRHFMALRSFYSVFYNVPDKFKDFYNYSYADINGVLFSYSLYKQNFYKTNFIYGFGRSEDVPQGLSATVTAGYTNKSGVRRAYYGLEFEGTKFSPKGHFTDYIFRMGSFVNNKKFEDKEILISLSRFTKLYRLGEKWNNRNFITAVFTKQLNPVLNAPLLLESTYGLPYFRNVTDPADTRSTVKFESVFYNTQKIAGFRFAPFIFSDLSLIRPVYTDTEKTKGFTSFGAGVRTRNENLVFGTIEIKGYIFPRVYEGMSSWKIEFSTNIRFKYNSSFLRPPSFITVN